MTDSDREEVAQFIEQQWMRRMVFSRGREIYPHSEEGFIEIRDGKIVGLLTFRVDSGEMEILTLNSLLEGQGLGSALMLAAIDEARHQGCTSVLLATTNDNIRGLKFYQRLGFRMTKINIGAVDEARKHKPEIPLLGQLDIPMHDEIIMQLVVKPFLDS